jgi:MYXO-CTERM domain-containing protein
MMIANRRARPHRTATAAIALTGLVAGSLALMPSPDARACGCFHPPPDPTVPILQAGERLVFTHKDGKVTAIIQMAYQGDARTFAWMIPLPSVPTMKLSVDEVFTQVMAATQPKYSMNKIAGSSCAWTQNRGGGPQFATPAVANAGASSGGEDKSGGSSPLVYQSSVGPFDYAVLKADDKTAMLAWLQQNNYVVPPSQNDVIQPYIRAGGFFLALKLQSGETSGNIQPVVLEYESDLPMIPVIPTSVSGTKNLGVQVFMLGDSRAIPRNYRHTILNEEHVDWFNAGKNYGDVVTAAVQEANGHHSFITEYAGTTDVMKNVLDPPGRFGDRQVFEGTSDAIRYVQLLRQEGFAPFNAPQNAGPGGGGIGIAQPAFSGNSFSSTLINVLKKYFPKPDQFSMVTDSQYYTFMDNFLMQSNMHPTFDAVALTGDVWDRVVTPTLDAGQLFANNPKLTRLYTTLSPEDMNLDPVFSFNPDLPDVSQNHEATFTYICDFFQDGPDNTPGILKLPADGREFYVKNQADWEGRNLTNIPYSSRIELLREEGAPQVEVDNSSKISKGDGASCACSSTDGSGTGFAGAAMMIAMVAGSVLVRRRKRGE